MPAHQNDEVPACGPDDLVVVVNWERRGTGLRGEVIAENVGDHACKLAGKPEVAALGPDGTPLPVRTTITLEWRKSWIRHHARLADSAATRHARLRP